MANRLGMLPVSDMCDHVKPRSGLKDTRETSYPATSRLNCGSCSCLVSSQRVASPPLSNGCGRQLHRPRLYREQGRAPDVLRKDGATGEARHVHPGGTTDPFILQEDPVGELEEQVYPYCVPTLRTSIKRYSTMSGTTTNKRHCRRLSRLKKNIDQAQGESRRWNCAHGHCSKSSEQSHKRRHSGTSLDEATNLWTTGRVSHFPCDVYSSSHQKSIGFRSHVGFVRKKDRHAILSNSQQSGLARHAPHLWPRCSVIPRNGNCDKKLCRLAQGTEREHAKYCATA